MDFYKELKEDVKAKARLFCIKNSKDFDKVIDDLFKKSAEDLRRYKRIRWQ